jgi:hypothetical protein
MRFDHQKAFPYPVLRPDIDDYLNSEFQVTVDIEGTKDNKKINAKILVALSSDLLTYGGAKMSGFGAEPERTGLGPHALPKNVRRFTAFAPRRQNCGQVLVRTSGYENTSDFNHESRLCQEV